MAGGFVARRPPAFLGRIGPTQSRIRRLPASTVEIKVSDQSVFENPSCLSPLFRNGEKGERASSLKDSHNSCGEGASIAGSGWSTALKWGTGVALAHRLLLGVWMAAVWMVISPWTTYEADFNAVEAYNLPRLSSPAEQLIFGVWRRWDANHYLNLAVHGYQPENPGPTVFGALMPLAFRFFDRVLPGPVDLAAMVCETLAFGLALTLLFRLCATHFGDESLARWAVGVTALQPLSYFFAAPLSESAYLALSLGTFYAAYRERWLVAGLCGFLATLARTQGVLLAAVAGLILLDKARTARDGLREIIRRSWALLLIPAGALVFTAFRAGHGLPPLSDVYLHYSYLFYTDPVRGLFLNARHFVRQWPHSAYDTDLLALIVSLVLGGVLLRHPFLDQLPLVGYTWLHLLLFLGKINRDHFTSEITYTQSFGRYALILFPLTLLVADWLRRRPSTRARFWCLVALLAILLVFSARHVLYLIGP